MLVRTPLRQLGAFAVALFLVFGLRIQDIDIQPWLGPVNGLWFRSYTPLFQGLDNIDTHEIFSPLYRDKKKIVILGASAADSLGCDGTWHHPDKSRDPEANAAYECSITNQLNQVLSDNGYTDWRAFNLARNGAKLTPSVYIYSRIVDLKPEIVIYADSGGYYYWENGGAAEITDEHRALVKSIVDRDPEAGQVWQNLFAVQAANGFIPKNPAAETPAPYPLFTPRDRVTVSDLLELFFERAGQFTIYDKGPPLPVKLLPFTANGGELPERLRERDKNYGFFQATTIFTRLQHSFGGNFLYLILPRSEITGPNRRAGWDGLYGTYILEHGGKFSSDLLDIDMIQGKETYDGGHHTIYGNRRIAAGILQILKDQNLIY